MSAELRQQTRQEQADQDNAQALIFEEMAAALRQRGATKKAQEYDDCAQLLRDRAAQYAELIEREAA